MENVYRIFPTPFELAEAAALEIVTLIKKSGDKPFLMALSGGKTPETLFSVLGDHFGNSVSWKNVHFFWVDERCVPPDDPESNYGMTRRAFLEKAAVPPENIHRIRGEEDPGDEAIRYSEEIREYTTKRDNLPFFDLILLGLGADGHTASIFPGMESLFFSEKICDVAQNPLTGQKRITLTGRIINNAGRIIFVVTGINKAGIVKEIVEKKENVKLYPASYVLPVSGSVGWYLDREAGTSMIVV